MSTITLDKPDTETGFFPAAPEASATPPAAPPPPTESPLERFRAFLAEGERLAEEVKTCEVAEENLTAICAKLEACDDEADALKLLKELAEAETTSKLKKIRIGRLTASEDEAWNSAAKLVPYAIDVAAEAVGKAAHGAWDEIYEAICATIDPNFRITIENIPGMPQRIFGSAETLASIQPGIARANIIQRELSNRRHSSGGLAKHHVRNAASEIDRAFSELPAIREESRLTKARAAAILAVK
jgi:hypothetical protein